MKRSVSVTERNKAVMRRFEIMINTNDKVLADKLISPDALFQTPVSPTPLKGGTGYLSVVDFMRSGFSDIQWKAQQIIGEENIVAVLWHLTGTHNGMFLGIQPTHQKISTTVMNFYYFNENGQIINDIAAEGMIGILRPLGLCQ